MDPTKREIAPAPSQAPNTKRWVEVLVGMAGVAFATATTILPPLAMFGARMEADHAALDSEVGVVVGYATRVGAMLAYEASLVLVSVAASVAAIAAPQRSRSRRVAAWLLVGAAACGTLLVALGADTRS